MSFDAPAVEPLAPPHSSVPPDAGRRRIPQFLRTHWPGVLLCAVIGLAASFISRAHGGPQLLYALLFGMSLHFLHDDGRIRPGIDLCTGTLLRLGVALLGVRITLEQITALGWGSALLVVTGVLSTILGGVWLAGRLGLEPAQGLLSGGATAICGASAALAISAVLPRNRANEHFTLLVIVAVTTLSTVAMLVYPLLVHALRLPPELAGLFLGGSIHDVAQVVAAGYLLGGETGDMALVVKLFRVALLALVVVAAAAAFRADGQASSAARPAPRRIVALVPWFLWVFLALVIVQSMHGVPSAIKWTFEEFSRDLLVLAIAGLGIRTSFQALRQTGWRPFVLLLCETLWLAAILLVAAVWMQRTAAA